MTAAHLHDLDLPVTGDLDAGHQRADLLDQDLGFRAVAELIDIFHAAAPLCPAEPRSSASSVCTRSQRM
jgi:hypothetical protein